ncbi:MAG TPA: hypothetical protein VGN07_09135 [Steroidobacteraceae bacterium]
MSLRQMGSGGRHLVRKRPWADSVGTDKSLLLSPGHQHDTNMTSASRL